MYARNSHYNQQRHGMDSRPHVLGADRDHFHQAHEAKPHSSAYQYSAGVSYPRGAVSHSQDVRDGRADARVDMRQSGYNDNFMMKVPSAPKTTDRHEQRRDYHKDPRDSYDDDYRPQRANPTRDSPSYETNFVPRGPELHRQAPPVERQLVRTGEPFNLMHGQPRSGGLLARPNYLPVDEQALDEDLNLFLEDVLDTGFQRLREGLDPRVWGKLLYMEKDCIVAKFNLREPEIVIDGSTHEFDTRRIGLGFYNNPERDEKTRNIRRQIGKGVVLRLERDHSVSARRLGDTGVFVGEVERPQDHCFSHELIEYRGQLSPTRHVPVFDMRLFREKLAAALGTADEQDTDLVTLFWMSLVQEKEHQLLAPAWLLLLHYGALRTIDDPDEELRHGPLRSANGVGRKRTVGRGEGRQASRIVRDWDDRQGPRDPRAYRY